MGRAPQTVTLTVEVKVPVPVEQTVEVPVEVLVEVPVEVVVTATPPPPLHPITDFDDVPEDVLVQVCEDVKQAVQYDDEPRTLTIRLAAPFGPSMQLLSNGWALAARYGVDDRAGRLERRLRRLGAVP